MQQWKKSETTNDVDNPSHALLEMAKIVHGWGTDRLDSISPCDCGPTRGAMQPGKEQGR